MTGVFEGVGSLQFSPDNKYAYGFSGSIINGDGETDNLLLFKTNSEYIDTQFEVGFGDQRFNDDMLIQLYLNDVVVAANVYNNNYEIGYDKRFNVIIPPFTNVKVEVVKKSGTGNVPVFLWLVGKVHGAIEQENLEAITNNNKWASK